MKKTTQNFYFIIVLFVFLLGNMSFFSCGGGGGGGGGASGPASSGSETESAESRPVASPTLQSANAITEFCFNIEDNPLLTATYSGTIDTATHTVEVLLPYGTNVTQLTPSIKVSSGASIEPASGVLQDFTSAVSYTVTAENNSVQVWTASIRYLAANQHVINYYLNEGSWASTVPDAAFSEDQQITLPIAGFTARTNYLFAGWYTAEDLSGSPVYGWNPSEKTEDVSLYAKWTPAPAASVETNEIYANGLPLLVEGDFGGGTTVYFDINANGSRDAGEPSLYEINNAYPANGSDLSAYTIYGGNSGSFGSPDVTRTELFIAGGTVQNVYGSNKGGTVPPSATVKIRGNPVIGNRTASGIHLSTLSGNKVLIVGSLTGGAGSITLIASSGITSGSVVAEATDSSYADAGKFILRNSSGNNTHNITVYQSNPRNIVVIGSVKLPEKPIYHNDGSFSFTLGDNIVTVDGTIFSILVNNGYFIVPTGVIPGAEFDMAIPYSKDGKSTYTEGSLDTSNRYTYVQFTSVTGTISAAEASRFLSRTRFYGNNITVSINLQTVDFAKIKAAGVTYFDGSFYKLTTGKHTWSNAYNNAKKSEFNGMHGYLMTITSQVENMFIYDRVLKSSYANPNNALVWLGGTAQTPTSDFDSDTWNSGGIGTSWQWANGPEAGQTFYNARTYSTGIDSTTSGMYSSWNNPVDTVKHGFTMTASGKTEPNNYNNTKECCLEYVGTYVWNDLQDSNTTTVGYIVEYSPYSTMYRSEAAAQTPIYDTKVYIR